MKQIKRYVIFAAAIAALAVPASAQDRFDNMQYSFGVGTMSVPQPTFTNLVNMPMDVQDLSNALPWNFGAHAEREWMASDLVGWGYSLGFGIRHTGWHFTVPAGTPAVGYTGLPHTEDWRVNIGLMGFTGDLGAFVSVHPSRVFEVYGGAGLAVSRYWEVKSTAESGGYVDESAGGGVVDGLSATLFGAYGLAGVKLTFNEDYFVSLSARYIYGLSDDGVLDSDITWDGPFYQAHVNAPYNSELLIMLGVGIMIETN